MEEGKLRNKHLQELVRLKDELKYLCENEGTRKAIINLQKLSQDILERLNKDVEELKSLSTSKKEGTELTQNSIKK